MTPRHGQSTGSLDIALTDYKIAADHWSVFQPNF